METDRNYFVVGLFVLALMGAGACFTLWLTSTERGDYQRYRIHYAESVSGLNIESAVKFRGVDVGSVEEISLDPKNSTLVRVDIRVREGTPVKTDTTATLKLYGITGDVFVELSGGSDNAQELVAADGQELPEIKAEPSSINAVLNRLPEITEKTSRLLDKANHIAGQVGKIFSDKNVRTVNKVVDKFGGDFGVEDDSQPPYPH